MRSAACKFKQVKKNFQGRHSIFSSLLTLCIFSLKVYLDDQMSGYVVKNNTFINCQVGILLGGGRKSLLADNHFVDVDLAVDMDNRGMNWEASSCQPPSGNDYV